ncbi:hypothetical protein AZE42_12580 [Rhizopogon vesiculosus]|uniref:Uncharacterized protein n=1 Tax=Rhizopogon vesiculosus TaxID=180088 RepID=A0A1J8PL19_9AGAM|nr:hypothetical protein AZE42_12580 [Rhizopogon vesiculosus]
MGPHCKKFCDLCKREIDRERIRILVSLEFEAEHDCEHKPNLFHSNQSYVERFSYKMGILISLWLTLNSNMFIRVKKMHLEGTLYVFDEHSVDYPSLLFVFRHGKETRTLTVTHLVFATGLDARPRVPDIPGKVSEVVDIRDHSAASGRNAEW